MTVISRKVSGFRFQVTGVGALLALGLTAAAAQRNPGAYFIPGDPKAGMRIFFDKGCARCHSVLGEGGRTAPDLGRAPAGHLSAAELVAAMWNHAPAMWEKIEAERIAAPKFTDAEMTDLFAFLYSVRSLDEPGDAERGRKLLSEKHCLECHALAGQGGRRAPDFRGWAGYRNPVSWIQAMWNHGASMQQAMASRGLSWPEFQGSDMADIIACIRSQAAGARGHAYLRSADSNQGRRLFDSKGCAACHTVRGAGSGRAPDLATTRNLPRTLGQFAAAMWNHGPTMWRRMQATGAARPQFSNQEMADLIAYLFTERFFEAAGDADRGQRMFAEKGCASCHGRGGAPALARASSASPMTVAAALWNHGPLMFEKMRRQRMAWPRFRPGEIVDLLDYLGRDGASVRQALAQPGGAR